ncbi:DUF1045 domain-containing protein [Rhodobacterales bacterium HKCCE2091]|nr:DUF1045 domain-containing protein [Rhodobacterales bacterium HKCCE2091]
MSDDFTRYAVYAVPDGAFHAAGAEWLGWDAVAGVETVPPDLPGLPAPAAELTATPRKYGFHGTLKPPFRLAPGTDRAELEAAVAELAATLRPVEIPDLAVRPLGRFVAIVPAEPSPTLLELAARVVRDLDRFRAAPSDAELARRRAARLTPRQDRNLADWGYPYVCEDFRFHLTLTGKVADADALAAILGAHFAEVLPRPYRLDSLALTGEGADGRFRLIHRYTLSR